MLNGMRDVVVNVNKCPIDLWQSLEGVLKVLRDIVGLPERTKEGTDTEVNARCQELEEVRRGRTRLTSQVA